MRLRDRILWFAVAGVAGFAADAGILTLLVRSGLDARPARLASFLAALTVTWLINRSQTFGDRAGAPALGEFLRYALASSIAGLINLGAFMLLVSASRFFAAWPVLAVAIATGLSMAINFWAYLKVVFLRRRR
ncbi:GtrA family protein [Labrys monachus]|uniref:Flippase GtrA n=1 Tax=Labrys monachus TaxID=217067 RepID=A0ABU0FF56_9HYPH|nr:GtrA family protein [Labrys monachus]MDQ0393244.1 putative flippase GtrA [Labrys monachus]